MSMLTESNTKLSLRRAYVFAVNNGLQSQAEAIKNMSILWDRGTKSGVRRGKMIDLLNKHNLMEKFIEEEWPWGNSPQAVTKSKWFVKVAAEYDEFIKTGSYDTTSEIKEDFDTAEESDEQEMFEFALEAHLRDFIAKHLSRLEPGLKLYENETRKGVEYSIDGGRIDILAVDNQGKYVVIELKLSKGRERTLGQLLYYMGWIDENLGNFPCRGIIVASEISDELVTAVSRVPGVTLARYKMTFDIETVKQIT